MIDRKDYYNAAYIAIFGGLWGITETLLGNFLHVLDLPFKGTIMSAIGCIICLVGGSMLPAKEKFPIITIGMVAVIIRLFSFGVFKIHVFLSMLTAACLIQGAVSFLGYNVIGFIVAGIFACFAPYMSAILFFGIIFGHGIMSFYHGIIKESSTLGYITHYSMIIAFFIIGINVVVGMIAGVSAWRFGKMLRVQGVVEQ